MAGRAGARAGGAGRSAEAARAMLGHTVCMPWTCGEAMSGPPKKSGGAAAAVAAASSKRRSMVSTSSASGEP